MQKTPEEIKAWEEFISKSKEGCLNDDEIELIMMAFEAGICHPGMAEISWEEFGFDLCDFEEKATKYIRKKLESLRCR